MGWIADEIALAVQLVNAHVRMLPKDESEHIKSLLAIKLNVARPLWHLWENVTHDVSVCDQESWKWIAEFVKDTTVVMFFNEDDESTVIEFQDGKDVVPVLAETSSFEFYLTDYSVSYTLCFNHHDYLVATGSAADWLQRKLEAMR